MTMEPAQVRDMVLRDHEELKAKLAHLYRVIAHADVQAMAREARVLLHKLAAHLELEDAMLAPVLRTIDAWGPVRADRLNEDHTAQRREISELLHFLEESEDAERIADRVSRFAETLERDMKEEEHDVLSSELLRDDTVSTDAFGG
jgi:hypothetical protein